jgi:hypothetical protein
MNLNTLKNREAKTFFGVAFNSVCGAVGFLNGVATDVAISNGGSTLTAKGAYAAGIDSGRKFPSDYFDSVNSR